MLAGVDTLGNAATSAGGIRQGSYQVKQVFDPENCDTITETTNTILKGRNSSGIAYLSSEGVAGTVVSRAETLTDASGARHDVNIVFTSTGPSTWNWTATGGIGGVWQEPVAVNGTVTFNSNGTLNRMTAAGSNVSLVGSKVTKTISDGSSGGQEWNVNFGFLRNNAQPPIVDNPVEPGNGTGGATPTTAVTFNCELDYTAAVGTIHISPSDAWVDRMGVHHDVSFVFQKIANQTGGAAKADKWSMHIAGLNAGGAWTGASENTSGVILEFDVNGDLSTVNGESSRFVEMVIGDGTPEGQTVFVDMHNLRVVDVAHRAGNRRLLLPREVWSRAAPQWWPRPIRRASSCSSCCDNRYAAGSRASRSFTLREINS